MIYAGYNFLYQKDSLLKKPAGNQIEDIADAYTADSMYPNKVLVCRDTTCTNPTPYVLEFNKHRGQPFVIEENGTVTGEIWGNELGWISMNAPYNGVYVNENGLMDGRAWSETSGVINFSVTGQEVSINKNIGEVSGWAWAGGPYGGWVKFDCAFGSCLHTTWRGVENKNI